MLKFRHSGCAAAVVVLFAARVVLASTQFEAEVRAVSAIHENGGVSIAWQVNGGAEFDPQWCVEARLSGSETGQVWKAVGLEIEVGREPGIAVYSAWIDAPETLARLELRLWAVEFQERPEEWFEVSVAPAVRPRPPLRLAGAVGSAQGERVRIVIKDTAPYHVSAAEIASALANVAESDVRGWIATTNLSLSCMGEQVAWHAVGAGDGIAFIGEAYRDVYTDRNVYWIEPGPGLAMEERSVAVPQRPHLQGSFRSVLHFEENLISRETFPAERTLDYWYWESLDTSTKANKNPVFLPFETPDPVGDGYAMMKIWWKLNLMNPVNSLPLALVTVSLKGETLLDLALDRNAPGVYEFDVPQVLLDDANDLKFSIKGTNGALRSVYIIDSLTVQYRREMAARDDMLLANLDASGQDVVVGGFSMADASAYSLSPGFQPERLVGGAVSLSTNGLWQYAFTAPAGVSNVLVASVGKVPETIEGVAADPWVGTEHEIDYMVVSPEAFLPTLQPLLDLRRSQGLRVGVITTADLYRHYNHGRFSPYALLDFIRHSRDWNIKPSMLLIVGWGHYDYFKAFDQSWQPSYVAPAIMEIPYSGAPSGKMLVASDNLLADLDGDKVPELSIGRLPAHNAVELARIVNKTLVYDATRNARTNALAVADLSEGIWHFNTHAGDWRALLPRGVDSLLISEPETGDETYKRQHIRNAWFPRLNSGVWLTGYFGHANTGIIGDEPVAYLKPEEVATLNNKSRAGIMIGTTCGLNEMFKPYLTQAQTLHAYLGARLLYDTEGGMAAVLAPTSISYEVQGGVIADAFAEAVGERRHIGEAVLDGLSALREHGNTQWLISTTLLLGDPAMDLRPAWTGTAIILR